MPAEPRPAARRATSTPTSRPTATSRSTSTRRRRSSAASPSSRSPTTSTSTRRAGLRLRDVRRARAAASREAAERWAAAGPRDPVRLRADLRACATRTTSARTSRRHALRLHDRLGPHRRRLAVHGRTASTAWSPAGRSREIVAPYFDEVEAAARSRAVRHGRPHRLRQALPRRRTSTAGGARRGTGAVRADPAGAGRNGHGPRDQHQRPAPAAGRDLSVAEPIVARFRELGGRAGHDRARMRTAPSAFAFALDDGYRIAGGGWIRVAAVSAWRGACRGPIGATTPATTFLTRCHARLRDVTAPTPRADRRGCRSLVLATGPAPLGAAYLVRDGDGRDRCPRPGPRRVLGARRRAIEPSSASSHVVDQPPPPRPLHRPRRAAPLPALRTRAAGPRACRRPGRAGRPARRAPCGAGLHGRGPRHRAVRPRLDSRASGRSTVEARLVTAHRRELRRSASRPAVGRASSTRATAAAPTTSRR